MRVHSSLKEKARDNLRSWHFPTQIHWEKGKSFLDITKYSPWKLLWLLQLDSPGALCTPHTHSTHCPNHIELLQVFQHINYTSILRLLFLLFPHLKHSCVAHSLTFFKSLLTVRSYLAYIKYIIQNQPVQIPIPGICLIPFTIPYFLL